MMNGRRVEELREEKGLSRKELAEAAGISEAALRSVVREERVMVRTAKKVGTVLGVDPRAIAQVYYAPEEAPRVSDFYAGLVMDGVI